MSQTRSIKLFGIKLTLFIKLLTVSKILKFSGKYTYTIVNIEEEDRPLVGHSCSQCRCCVTFSYWGVGKWASNSALADSTEDLTAIWPPLAGFI
jgi:hypothetical protein